MIRVAVPSELPMIRGVDDEASALYAAAGLNLSFAADHPFVIAEQLRWKRCLEQSARTYGRGAGRAAQPRGTHRDDSRWESHVATVLTTHLGKRAGELAELVEVPERLAKVLELLVKADELGEQMASGTEKLDWRRLSSEIEAAGSAAEREISRRALQRLDEHSYYAEAPRQRRGPSFRSAGHSLRGPGPGCG